MIKKLDWRQCKRPLINEVMTDNVRLSTPVFYIMMVSFVPAVGPYKIRFIYGIERLKTYTDGSVNDP